MASVYSKFKRNVLFLLPVILLWALVILFLSHQYSKEKEHKINELDVQLQLLNRFLITELSEGVPIDKAVKGYSVLRHGLLCPRRQSNQNAAGETPVPHYLPNRTPSDLIPGSH